MFPLFTTKCLHVRHDVRDPSGGSGHCVREGCPVIFAEITTSTPFRDLLHAANLRHGTDGFTSPPKEGVLKIFSPLKIRRLRSGLNPRTWVLKASTLPLDHRSRLFKNILPFSYFIASYKAISSQYNNNGSSYFTSMNFQILNIFLRLRREPILIVFYRKCAEDNILTRACACAI